MIPLSVGSETQNRRSDSRTLLRCPESRPPASAWKGLCGNAPCQQEDRGDLMAHDVLQGSAPPRPCGVVTAREGVRGAWSHAELRSLWLSSLGTFLSLLDGSFFFHLEKGVLDLEDYYSTSPINECHKLLINGFNVSYFLFSQLLSWFGPNCPALGRQSVQHPKAYGQPLTVKSCQSLPTQMPQPGRTGGPAGSRPEKRRSRSDGSNLRSRVIIH